MGRDDATLWWNAVVYAACFYLLGLGIAKSIIIFPVALVSGYVNYGRRWILRAGFALLVITVLVTIGAVPAPSTWANLLAATVIQVASNVQSHY